MNQLLEDLLSDLNNEQITPNRIELSIRKLAAILSTHEERLDQLQQRSPSLKESTE